MSYLPPVRTVQHGGYIAAAMLLFIVALVLLRSCGEYGDALSGNDDGDQRPAASNQTPANDRVLTVGPRQQFETISQAVEVAVNGDILQVHAGVYPESVRLTDPIVIQAAGDGDVWIDGECERDIGVHVYSGDGTVISGIGVRNTNGPGILIGNTGNDATPPQHITVEQSTIENFNCADGDAQLNAGIAVWHGRCCMRIAANTITYRTEGDAHGRGNGIWFKSTDDVPSGGGHLIARNTIIGGWDGIGGEAEGDEHGTFDKNTVIENNVISGCWDDGIQSEGGNENVTIRNNDISGCGTGIAFAPTLVGPLKIEGNTIHDLERGLYDNLFCYKVGSQGDGKVHLTNNVCDTEGDGLLQTNSGLPVIVASGNCFHVTRYVIQLGEDIPNGTSFNDDTMWTTDPSRFVDWGGEPYASIEEFRETGNESRGLESPIC
jgi:parallel beta-helix repeat protein